MKNPLNLKGDCRNTCAVGLQVVNDVMKLRSTLICEHVQ